MIKAKKSLGQNFLIDQNILNKIVNFINIENKPNLVKIIDLLGRDSYPQKNIPLFYIYDNGEVSKVILK